MSDVVLALDAYSLGQAGGRVVFFVLGLALVRAGLAKRRKARSSIPVPVPAGAVPQQDRWSWTQAPTSVPAAAQPATAAAAAWGAPATATPPPAGAGDFFAPLPAAARAVPTPSPAARVAAPQKPSSSAGVVHLVIGVVLLVVGTAGLLLPTPLDVERQVSMPATLLGLPQDTAASSAMAAGLPDFNIGIDDVESGLYGGPTDGVVVIAASGDIDDPADVLGVVGARAGVDGGRPVSVGRLGGEARCWSMTLAGAPAEICGFADHGSLVVALLIGDSDPVTAAARALEVREAVVTEG